MSAWRRLGRSGLQVSPICLGTANFGWVTDTPTAHRMLDHAVGEGVNFVDTADTYNKERNEDQTECILGRWLSASRDRRNQIILATKVYGAVGDGPNDRGLSAWHIERACEASLRRLKTDRIDIYQMHHVDRNTPWDETCEAMSRLIQSGKVLYMGSSNFAGWHIASMHLMARAAGMFGLVSEQSPYGLAERRVEAEVLPACRHHGIGFLAYSPLGGGLLGGPEAGVRRSQEDVQARRHDAREKLGRFHALCDDLRTPPAEIALAWLLAQPGVSAAVVGPRNLEQLASTLAATRLSVDETVTRAVSSIFPGPGVSPEAYAW